MKTTMSIVFFFMTILSISASSLSPIETCIRRNIERSQPPSSSLALELKKSSPKMFKSLVDTFCRDGARAVMFSVRINGKFPAYYVKAMCNVFGGDVEKVKDYVLKKWFAGPKLSSNLSCTFH